MPTEDKNLENLELEHKDSFEDKIVLVTGGAGFIGSHLVETLVLLGAKAIILDDFTTGKIENIARVRDDCKIIAGDISNSETVKEIGKVDLIFNEAAVSLLHSFRKPVRDLLVNAGGLINLLELARRFDCKIIHGSTGSIYGNPIRIPISEDHPLNPISPYGISKLAAEFYCDVYSKTYDIDVCCLRYFNVYGPRQRIGEETGVVPIFVTRLFNNQELLINGDGKQTRDFVYVKDVVKANLLAALAENIGGQKMNIGGRGFEISIVDLAHMIAGLAKKELNLRFGNPKPGDITRLVADISKAKSLIDYEPKFSLEQGLKNYIEWYTNKKFDR